jgi:hypothetical protein
MLFNRRASALLLCTLALMSTAAMAQPIHYDEATEDPSGDFQDSSYIHPASDSVGVLGRGINTIRGSLVGECTPDGNSFFCNGGVPGDMQDSVNFQVPVGMRLTYASVTTSNLIAPEGFLRGSSVSSIAANHGFHYTPSTMLVTPNFLSHDLFSGVYDATMFGFMSDDAGPFSFEYVISLGVTVPEPTSLTLLGFTALLIGVKRRTRSLINAKGAKPPWVWLRVDGIPGEPPGSREFLPIPCPVVRQVAPTSTLPRRILLQHLAADGRLIARPVRH